MNLDGGVVDKHYAPVGGVRYSVIYRYILQLQGGEALSVRPIYRKKALRTLEWDLTGLPSIVSHPMNSTRTRNSRVSLVSYTNIYFVRYYVLAKHDASTQIQTEWYKYLDQ